MRFTRQSKYRTALRVCSRRLTIAWLNLLCLAAMFLVSCGAPKLPGGARDPADTIRFHTWEDYYERGRRRILAGRIQPAREDFETCLGLRKGARRKNDHDDWRARTHGMHMFNGYFPNRELGICLFHLGDLPNALKYLTRSLLQTPTSRAKYFINQVSAAQLASAPVDPPSISFETRGPVWTKDGEYSLMGRASGPGKISQIMINNNRLFIDLAETEIPISEAIPLSAGENRVQVVVTDLKTNSASSEVVVYADWQRPQLSIIDVTKEGDDRRIELECVDNYGFTSLRFHDDPLSFDTSTNRAAFTLTAARNGPAKFSAVDLAGNELTVDLRTMTDLTPDGTPYTEHVSRDPESGLPLVEESKEGPLIRLQHEQDVYTVHRDRFFVDGEVISTSGLERLELNEKDLLSELSGDARRIRFASFYELEDGTNVLNLVAIDTSGRKRERVFSVVKSPPDYVKKSYLLGASVPPLYASHKESDGYAWQTRIAEQIIKARKARFNLLSLDAEDVQAVFEEMKLQLADLVDPRARIDYSRLNAADKSFNGLLVHHQEGVEIRIHLVDVEAGAARHERDGYVDVYINDPDENRDAQDGSEGLAIAGLISKIERHYPVLSGRVCGLSGNQVIVDIGEESGLNMGSRFLVVRPGDDGSLERGEVLVDGGRIVQLRVIELGESKSVAEVLPKESRHHVSEGNYVYAR